MILSKENRYLLLAVLLIILITIVIPYNAKGWLVSEGGNLQILPPHFGVLLVLGLICKWRYIRKIATAAYTLPMAGSLIMLIEHPYEWGFYLLIFSNALLLWVLCSQTMKSYFIKDKMHQAPGVSEVS